MEFLALKGWGCTLLRCFLDGVCTWSQPPEFSYTEARKMKKKKAAQTASDAQHLAAVESQLFSKLQSLISHAAVTKYDDGDPRQPGWFTVKTMGSAWVIEIKDPDTAMRLVVVQQTLDEALMLASLLLESEEAPWEPDPWLSAQKAKAKKK